MKKLLLFLGSIALTLLAGGFAPLDRPHVWTYYKITVNAPDDFTVVKNTSEAFDLEGNNRQLKLSRLEQDVATDDLGEAAFEAANALGLDAVGEPEPIGTDGLEGYYVEGRLNRDRVMLAGLMDPDSPTNFLVVITFDDEDETAQADALRILNSVRRLK